jgi:hypothetical protein
VLPPPSISAEVRLAEATGLPLDRIVQGDTLTDADLAALGTQQREMLVEYLNEPICGLVRKLGLGADPTFRPSAVFVAQQAAALVVGALLRRFQDTSNQTAAARHVQFDALLGPRDGHTVPRRAAASCTCQQDGDLIRKVRLSRATAP